MEVACEHLSRNRALPIVLLHSNVLIVSFFFFQAEDGIRDLTVTGVQTCALPIWPRDARIDLTSPVRLAKPILNSEVRRAVVPCFKGRIRWAVPRLVWGAAEVKPQSRSAIDRPIVTSILWRPVVAPGSVAGLVLWDAASPIVIPAAPAAIRGFGGRADNGQCSDRDNQSSHAAHVCLLVHWQQLELGRSQIQIRTDRSELGQHPLCGKEHIANGEQIVYIAPSLAVRCRSSESGPIRSGSNDHRITSRRRFVHG